MYLHCSCSLALPTLSYLHFSIASQKRWYCYHFGSECCHSFCPSLCYGWPLCLSKTKSGAFKKQKWKRQIYNGAVAWSCKSELGKSKSFMLVLFGDAVESKKKVMLAVLQRIAVAHLRCWSLRCILTFYGKISQCWQSMADITSPEIEPKISYFRCECVYDSTNWPATQKL